jgi:hypothetical protein
MDRIDREEPDEALSDVPRRGGTAPQKTIPIVH